MYDKVYVTTDYTASRFDLLRKSLINADNLFNENMAGTIVIKPNFLSCRNLGASTHPDALRAVVEFFRCKYPKNRIIVAEGSHMVDEYVEKYNIIEMLAEYGVEFFSINSDETEWLQFDTLAMDGKTLLTSFSKTIFCAELLVSLCVPKTHANLGLTAAMKNMVGGIKREERCHMHGVYGQIDKKKLREHGKRLYDFDSSIGKIMMKLRKEFPLSERKKQSIMEERETLVHNLKKLYSYRSPDFSIADGYTVMEGNGPWHGNIVDYRTVFLSRNVTALDKCIAQYARLPIALLGYVNDEMIEDKNIIRSGDVFQGKALKPHFFYENKDIVKCMREGIG